MRAYIFSALVTFIAALALLSAGCGQKSPLKDIKNFNQEIAPSMGEPKEPFDPYSLDPEKAVSIEGFSLWIVDETNQPNAELSSLYQLSKKEMDDGEVLLTIAVHGSPGIPHSLLYLRYDSLLLNPKAVEIGGFFGKKSEYLSLYNVWQPGVISLGIARIHPEKGMPSGDGAVATVAFEKRSFDNATWRKPSKAPGGEQNRAQDFAALSSRNKITLIWTEVNVGDYDNSGDVGIPDITPIALRFGSINGDGVDDQIDSYVDGDKNDEVGISDITPIAENYLATLSGYRVYRTTDVSGSIDYTEPYLGFATGPVTIGRLDPPPDNRRPSYVYIDTDVEPDREYNYKVVPYDLGDGVEGAPSRNAYVVVTDRDETPPIWLGPGGISSAVPGDGVVKVYFDSATDADSPPVRYSLLYAEGETIGLSDKTKEIRGIESSPFYLGSDPAHGIVNGRTYFIAVRAYDFENNETGFFPVVTATPNPGLGTDINPPVWDDPLKVGAYEVINGDGMLRVEFGTASDEQSPPASYTVYWQLGNTGVNKTQPTGWAANAVSPFIIDNLTNDEIYSVLATASDNANPPNETQNTTYMLGMPTTGGSSDLEAPIWRDVDESGIKDVVPGDGDVRVSWYLADDAGTPPVTYNVYWEENDGTSPLDYETAVLADRVMIGVAGDNVLVNGLVNGRSYRFSVRAQDSAIPPNVTQNTESLTAAPVPGGDTNPPQWVGAPGIQSAVAGSRQVTLSWNSATDLEGNGVFYNFYWESDTGVGPLDYVAARTAQPPRFERTSETSGIVYNLTNGNSYRFAARTVDSLGNEDTNEVSLTAIPVFTGVVSITTVDNTGDTGYMPSIAASPSGEFGIAYFNKTDGNLMYATAPSRSGAWTTEIVDNTAGQVRGAFPSLAYDILGRPHIAYLDWTRAEDATPGTRVLYTTNSGTSWSSPEVVAGVGVQGYDDFFDAPRISLDAAGVPYVSFVDTTTEELVVAKRQGAGSWTTGRPFAAGPAELRGTLIADIVFFNPGTGATYGVAWHEPADGITFAYYDTAALDYVWEVVGSGAPNDGLYIDLAVNGIGRPVATWMNNVSAPLSLPQYAVRRGANDWAVENVDVPFTNSGVSTGVAIKAVTGVPAGLPAVAWFTPGSLGGRFALDDLANQGFQTPSTFDPLAARDGFLLGICADNGSGLPGKCLIAYTAPAGALAKLNVAVEN